MTRRPARHADPRLESLEPRLQPSATVPANSIGTGTGMVVQAGGVSSASVAVVDKNLTVSKPSTLFGIFVAPEAGSALIPRIVAVKESDGRSLPLKQGRPFLAGRADGQAAAFVKVNEAGPLTVFVSGGSRTTGRFALDVTLAGDASGDGSVSLADLAPFAAAYGSSAGGKGYNVAADFNQDGIVNQIDAKAIEQNMPHYNAHPLNLEMFLSPADQAHYKTPKNSGGAASKRVVTVVGRTLPGSIAIQDGTDGFYKWTGPAFATDARGYFTAQETLTQGVNTFDFLIIGPGGKQLIRSFPIFWLPFAAPGSKLK